MNTTAKPITDTQVSNHPLNFSLTHLSTPPECPNADRAVPLAALPRRLHHAGPVDRLLRPRGLLLLLTTTLPPPPSDIT